MKFKIFGGPGPITNFSDTLQRVTGLNDTGRWQIGYSDPNQVSWYNTTGGITTNVGTGLQLRNPSGGGASVSIPIVCSVLSAIGGQTQFAEVQIAGHNTPASCSAGPAVGMTGDSSFGQANGYFIALQVGGNCALLVANVGQRLINNFGLTFADNDIWRLNLTYQPTQNVLQAFKNGSLIGTFNDNNAARPLSSSGGLPGIYYKGMSTLNFLQFINFRGGLGLG